MAYTEIFQRCKGEVTYSICVTLSASAVITANILKDNLDSLSISRTLTHTIKKIYNLLIFLRVFLIICFYFSSF